MGSSWSVCWFRELRDAETQSGNEWRGHGEDEWPNAVVFIRTSDGVEFTRQWDGTFHPRMPSIGPRPEEMCLACWRVQHGLDNDPDASREASDGADGEWTNEEWDEWEQEAYPNRAAPDPVAEGDESAGPDSPREARGTRTRSGAPLHPDWGSVSTSHNTVRQLREFSPRVGQPNSWGSEMD